MTRRRKTLIVFGLLFGVVCLVSVFHHYQLRFAVASYLKDLKERGAPMELEQVVPPHVPPERNSAPLFWNAAALLATNRDVLFSNSPSAMHGVAPGRAMIGWQQPEIRFHKITNSWSDVGEALEKNAGALRLLRQMTNNSIFDFDLQYSQRFEIQITNLVSEKKAVQVLSANALHDLHLGDPGSAGKSIQTMLVLVNGTGDERTVISQLVRAALAQIAVSTTWEFLQSSNLTEESLAALQESWSRVEFLGALERALFVEREGEVHTVTKWRDSDSEFQHYFDLQKSFQDAMGNRLDDESLWDKAALRAKIFLWRYWWSYPDELRYLKGCDVLIDTARRVKRDGFYKPSIAERNAALKQLGISELNDSMDSLFAGRTDLHSMTSESIVTLSRVFNKVMRVDTAREIAVTAIALKRYELKHGAHPETLELLAPGFVSDVPVDPVDGRPLRYRLNADGRFLLYSVGENGIDDGGVASLPAGTQSADSNWQSSQALDWVWPQPASQQEIQAYYER